jgi:hypothetical protein
MIALDVMKRELKVGQTVAFCMAGVSQNMRTAKVLRVLPKTVELDAEREYGLSNIRRNHHSVAIVEVTQ